MGNRHSTRWGKTPPAPDDDAEPLPALVYVLMLGIHPPARCKGWARAMVDGPEAEAVKLQAI